jgi:hypothetical protein
MFLLCCRRGTCCRNVGIGLFPAAIGCGIHLGSGSRNLRLGLTLKIMRLSCLLVRSIIRIIFLVISHSLLSPIYMGSSLVPIIARIWPLFLDEHTLVGYGISMALMFLLELTKF